MSRHVRAVVSGVIRRLCRTTLRLLSRRRSASKYRGLRVLHMSPARVSDPVATHRFLAAACGTSSAGRRAVHTTWPLSWKSPRPGPRLSVMYSVQHTGPGAHARSGPVCSTSVRRRKGGRGATRDVSGRRAALSGGRSCRAARGQRPSARRGSRQPRRTGTAETMGAVGDCPR